MKHLYQSQEINPMVVKADLERQFGKSTRSFNITDVGLFKMFNHDRLAPMSVTWDFSKGKEKNISLIGKGILYDSGGYNIKPDASDMFGDRFGALMAIRVAKKLKLPVTVFLAVNLIHDKALLPGTTLTTSRGKDVRIVDIDAEGRVGLAQLIEYLSEHYKKIISFATLTGHSPYAVGSGHAEVFSKDSKLLSKILMLNNPIVGIGRYFKDYDKALYRNNLLENYNNSYNAAGAGKAYAFLCKFLSKNTELIHFDIAGLMADQKTKPNYGFNEILNIIEECR